MQKRFSNATAKKLSTLKNMTWVLHMDGGIRSEGAALCPLAVLARRKSRSTRFENLSPATAGRYVGIRQWMDVAKAADKRQNEYRKHLCELLDVSGN